MLQFRYASRASQGARSYQEDAAAVWPGDGDLVPKGDRSAPKGAKVVGILADGMGGHAGGALASSTICSTFLAHVLAPDVDVRTALEGGLKAANTAIGAKVREKPALAGMGATLVGVAFGAGGLSWISVGDSPMYLLRKGKLEQLNADHSLAPVLDRMVTEGRLTAEQARSDPRRHLLRSAVTGEEIELVDRPSDPRPLEAGDIIIVASDGIHTLDHDEIKGIVTKQTANGPAAMAEHLIKAVDAAGEPHQDNTTVIVVQVEPSATT